MPQWLPALDGVVAKLESGARVADLGCGHGASTMLLAQAYPKSTFHGSDYHEGSIDQARKRAAEAGVADRVTFEVAVGADLRRARLRPRRDVRLPARHGRPAGRGPAHPRSLAPDGTWLIVEPAAGDTSRTTSTRWAGSTTTSRRSSACPTRMSQTGGYALGAQAGEAAIRQVVTDAGFTQFRQVAETPFNNVFEARP